MKSVWWIKVIHASPLPGRRSQTLFAGMRPSEIEGVVGERDGLQWQDINFKHRNIRIRPEVAGKLAEPRYITFSEKVVSGLTNEMAETIWTTLTSWILPYSESSWPVNFCKCQRIISPELQNADMIEAWPKDGLRHTWISSMLALGVHRDWIAEMAGDNPDELQEAVTGESGEGVLLTAIEHQKIINFKTTNQSERPL